MLAHSIYQHKESKDWVTFVHGAGGSSTIWFKQIREFREHFNVLILDLRGHGRSKNHLKSLFEHRYTFKSIAHDILEVLDYLKIEASHFVGISLGTIIIRQLAEEFPDRIVSMVMGGAVMKMNFKGSFLIKVGNIFKNLLPYLLLYKIFAFAIMPKNTHKASRNLFINEAKKLYQAEFIKWFKLTSDIKPLLRLFRQVEINIPTFYIMGEDDHMFLPAIEKIVKLHYKSARLYIVKNCGHVVNVDQAKIFNDQVIHFLKHHSKLN